MVSDGGIEKIAEWQLLLGSIALPGVLIVSLLKLYTLFPVALSLPKESLRKGASSSNSSTFVGKWY